MQIELLDRSTCSGQGEVVSWQKCSPEPKEGLKAGTLLADSATLSISQERRLRNSDILDGRKLGAIHDWSVKRALARS